MSCPLGYAGERPPRDSANQRSREPKERTPRGGNRGAQNAAADGAGPEGHPVAGDPSTKRPPRQRGPKSEPRPEIPTTPTESASDTSGPQRARRNNRGAPPQGAPAQGAPRSAPIAVPASVLPRPTLAVPVAPAPPVSAVPVQRVAVVAPPAALLVQQPPPGLPPPPPPVGHTVVGPPGLVSHGQAGSAGWGHTLGAGVQQSTTVVTNPARQAWDLYTPQTNHPRQPPGILSPSLDPVAPRAAVSDTGDGVLKAHPDRTIERMMRPASAGSSAGFDAARPKLAGDPVPPPHAQNPLQAHNLGLALHPQNPALGNLPPPPAIPFGSQFGFHQQQPPQQIAQVWANDQPASGVHAVGPPPPPPVSNTSSPAPRPNPLGAVPFGSYMGTSSASLSHSQLGQATPPPPPAQQPQPQQEQQQVNHFGLQSGLQFGQMPAWNTPFVQTGRAPDWSNKGVGVTSQAGNSLHNAADAVVSGPASAFRHPPPGLGAPGPPTGALGSSQGPPGLSLRCVACLG
jgi:hypothetical protein